MRYISKIGYQTKKTSRIEGQCKDKPNPTWFRHKLETDEEKSKEDKVKNSEQVKNSSFSEKQNDDSVKEEEKGKYKSDKKEKWKKMNLNMAEILFLSLYFDIIAVLVPFILFYRF